eukprot:scaffold34587_cov160-Skeletonema_menzelii.AAC.4
MTSNSIIAKSVAALHLLASVVIWGPIAFEPMAMYETVGIDSVSSAVTDALLHMSYLVCYLLILKAIIVAFLVFNLESPRLGMIVIITSWLLNASCQIIYPWPHKKNDMALNLFGTSIMPAWFVIYVFLALATIGYINITLTHDGKTNVKSKEKKS